MPLSASPKEGLIRSVCTYGAKVRSIAECQIKSAPPAGYTVSHTSGVCIEEKCNGVVVMLVHLRTGGCAPQVQPKWCGAKEKRTSSLHYRGTAGYTCNTPYTTSFNWRSSQMSFSNQRFDENRGFKRLAKLPIRSVERGCM